MIDALLTPKILWGQHRTSELLALSIYKQLFADSEISAQIPFIEFQPIAHDDYIPALKLMREVYDLDGNCNRFFDEQKAAKKAIQPYEEGIRKEHGPLVFNLHDSYKVPWAEWDIQFRIPSYIEEDEKLGQFLKETATKYGLKLDIRYYHDKPEDMIRIPSPENIIVEFAVPSAETLLSYSSPEIEESMQLCQPSVYGTFHSYVYQIPDTNHPIFTSTLKLYTTFMKEVIMKVHELGLHSNGQ